MDDTSRIISSITTNSVHVALFVVICLFIIAFLFHLSLNKISVQQIEHREELALELKEINDNLKWIKEHYTIKKDQRSNSIDF